MNIPPLSVGKYYEEDKQLSRLLTEEDFIKAFTTNETEKSEIEMLKMRVTVLEKIAKDYLRGKK